jgi:Bacteriophage probable baseplate hub protein
VTPAFKIVAAGINITPQIKDRLLGLTVKDEAGFKSDTVEIILDDRDNAIELPLPGAPIAVFMGYEETFLVPVGVFTADEVLAKGPPDTVTIRGKAANLGGSMQEQKTRAWDEQTIADIVATVAGEHGLEPKVAERYAGFYYDHLDQTDESDINFLTRIAQDHDAIATVKGEALLFIGRGEGLTASGVAMLPVPITKSGKLKWSMALAARGDFRSVEAYWHDQESGTRRTVTVGDGAPVRKLRHVYATEVEAESAAQAKLDEAQRGKDTLKVDMPGNALIAAEGQILALGFRIGVSGLWSITSARHQINGRGFTTSIQTEKPKSGAG